MTTAEVSDVDRLGVVKGYKLETNDTCMGCNGKGYVWG